MREDIWSTQALFGMESPMRHLDHGRKVTITRMRLLETLVSNRAKHKAEYLEAMEGWHNRVKLSALDFADYVKNTPVQKISFQSLVAVREDRPKSYLKAYDEAIELFEWDEVDQVTLTMQEFRSYIADKWDWTEDFAATYASNLLR